MQLSTIIYLYALLPALGLAAPAGPGARAVAAPASKGGIIALAANANVSDTQLLNAVNGWMNDTGKVTNFLNTATSLTGDDYTTAATIALNAEKDELNHKAVLDAGLDPQVISSANDTLATQGNFQAVVDSLQAMVNEGPETAQQRVTEINNNRCVNVLPNINAYFSAAGSPDSSAIVPTGCLEVAATNPGSVVPTGVPRPNAGGNNAAPAQGGNNNGNASITSAPANGNASATSSSSSSSSTSAAGNNNNNNNNGNNGNNGNNQNGGNNQNQGGNNQNQGGNNRNNNGNNQNGGNGNGNGNASSATSSSSSGAAGARATPTTSRAGAKATGSSAKATSTKA